MTVTRSQVKKPIQETFLADLAPETVSAICSRLNLKDFYRFQSSSKLYHKTELYSSLMHFELQSQFHFLLQSDDCPKADEILANIVMRGGNVKLEILSKFTWSSQSSAAKMIRGSFFKLFKALFKRNSIAMSQLNILLSISAYEGHMEFCKLLVQFGSDVNFIDPNGSLIFC